MLVFTIQLLFIFLLSVVISIKSLFISNNPFILKNRTLILNQMIEVGQQYHEKFMFTQAEVNEFARITGDINPIHLDEAYAAQTPFKKPIMHGMLGAGLFLSQQLDFKRPMFVDVMYEAVITVKEVNREKHTALFTTEIIDKATGKICTSGEAQLMNKEKI
jgi:acyl dehydratase